RGVLAMKDRLATFAIWLASGIALLPLGLILWVVVRTGFTVMVNHFPHFLFADYAHTAPEDPISKAGVGHAVVGSVEQVGLAATLAVPISLAAAIFLVESRSRFVGPFRVLVEAMSSMPTIIAGLIVYITWVQPHGTNGKSGFAAACALAILMAP